MITIECAFANRRSRRRTPGRRERISFLERMILSFCPYPRPLSRCDGRGEQAGNKKAFPQREGHNGASDAIGRSARRATPQRPVALPIKEGEHENVEVGAHNDHRFITC
jgi:hypothetical protein